MKQVNMYYQLIIKDDREAEQHDEYDETIYDDADDIDDCLEDGKIISTFCGDNSANAFKWYKYYKNFHAHMEPRLDKVTVYVKREQAIE